MYCRLEHKDPKLRDPNLRHAIMAIGEVEDYYLAMIPSHGSMVYAVLKVDYAPTGDHDGSDLI